MKYVILLLALSFCAACAHRTSSYSHLEQAEIITKNTNASLTQNGFYEISTRHQYRTLIGGIEKSYGTRQHRFTTNPEVRNFFCDFMKEYLKPLNEDQSLKPYLEHYPLTWKDMNLSIVFFDEAGRPLTKPYIGAIRNVKDSLYYEYCDPVTGKYSAYATEEMELAYNTLGKY
jgi:hypothetical protein